MSVFGALVVWDHPFVVLPVEGGGSLHLPCGTVPTMLEEYPKSPVTVMYLALGGGKVIERKVLLPATEIQRIFKEGAQKMNRAGEDLQVFEFPRP